MLCGICALFMERSRHGVTVRSQANNNTETHITAPRMQPCGRATHSRQPPAVCPGCTKCRTAAAATGSQQQHTVCAMLLSQSSAFFTSGSADAAIPCKQRQWHNTEQTYGVSNPPLDLSHNTLVWLRGRKVQLHTSFHTQQLPEPCRCNAGVGCA